MATISPNLPTESLSMRSPISASTATSPSPSFPTNLAHQVATLMGQTSAPPVPLVSLALLPMHPHTAVPHRATLVRRRSKEATTPMVRRTRTDHLRPDSMDWTRMLKGATGPVVRRHRLPVLRWVVFLCTEFLRLDLVVFMNGADWSKMCLYLASGIVEVMITYTVYLTFIMNTKCWKVYWVHLCTKFIRSRNTQYMSNNTQKCIVCLFQ